MVREQRPEDRQIALLPGITVHSGSKTNTSGRTERLSDELHFVDARYGSALRKFTVAHFADLIKCRFPRPGFHTQLTSRPSPSISCPAASQPVHPTHARYAFQSPPGAAPAHKLRVIVFLDIFVLHDMDKRRARLCFHAPASSLISPSAG